MVFFQAICHSNVTRFYTFFTVWLRYETWFKRYSIIWWSETKIVIANVILKNPKILILDEATSALDTINKDIVQETLNQIQKGRTTLVITHDIESVKNLDRFS